MERLPITNPWPSAPVYYLESTGSTMDDAFVLASGGAVSGTVVAAGHQRRGRGRLGERTWSDEAGRNLLFTLILKESFSFPPQRLPVLVGLALSLALRDLYNLETLVKWPNDLLCNGRKMAGILCQARGAIYLAGVGLNCNQRSFPPDLAGSSCSLVQLLRTGEDIPVPALLERVLAAIKDALADGSWKEKLLKRLYGLGSRLTVVQSLPGAAPRELTGQAEGIGDDGALLLRPEPGGELIAVASGELRRI
jgi:BirA family biotin operon repressor/biotin-[acetyl-CoA-carboxylase] ligase